MHNLMRRRACPEAGIRDVLVLLRVGVSQVRTTLDIEHSQKSQKNEKK